MRVTELGYQSAYTAPEGAGLSSPLIRSALGVISEHLGLTRDQTEAALRQGASVDSMARRQGVSTDTLRAVTALHINQSRTAAGQTEIPAAQLERTLARVFALGRPAAGAAAVPDGAGGPEAPPGEGSDTAPGGLSVYA